MSHGYLGKPDVAVHWDVTFEMSFLPLLFLLHASLSGPRRLSRDKRLMLNVECEDCWTLLESKYLTRFPSLALPALFPPSLLGSWQSSMRIFSLSLHMCQHRRPTTAWNNRGQCIEGGIGPSVSFPYLSLPWLTSKLVWTCLGLCTED